MHPLRRTATADRVRYQRMTTAELRSHFLVENLFAPGVVDLAVTDVDRALVGSVVPMDGPLALGAAPELRAAFFLERRELGVLNVGGPGRITVDGAAYEMAPRDGLYVGRGSREVSLESASPSDPAAFYLLSYPAHASHPTAQAKRAEAEAVALGETATCNRRTIYKYIHPRGIPSCQLVMGLTELEEGSAWNTVPPHTHARRSEVYFYFGMRPEAPVVHFMGTPQETRHLLVADRQVVLSPDWSIHAGAGIGRYSFCWGMGGENQDFDDIDPEPVPELR